LRGRARRHHRHPRERGLPLGLHEKLAVRVRGRLRRHHLRSARPHVARARPRLGKPRGGQGMSAGAETDRSTPLERVLTNVILIAAVIYALYPVLWVISLALSPSATSEARALPIPRDVTLDNFRVVTGWSDPERSWLFMRQ